MSFPGKRAVRTRVYDAASVPAATLAMPLEGRHSAFPGADRRCSFLRAQARVTACWERRLLSSEAPSPWIGWWRVIPGPSPTLPGGVGETRPKLAGSPVVGGWSYGLRQALSRSAAFRRVTCFPPRPRPGQAHEAFGTHVLVRMGLIVEPFVRHDADALGTK